MAENAVAAKPALREFTVEFGDSNCNRITINSLAMTVRGAWSLEKLHSREMTGPNSPRGCRAISTEMAGMPPIPGVRLKLNPRNRTGVLYDPLDDDQRLAERINNVGRRARLGDRLERQERVELRLTADKFKSVLRDLIMLRDECGAVHVVDGELPTMDQVDELPGEYEYDPWNVSPSKPKYRKDVDQWRKELERQI